MSVKSSLAGLAILLGIANRSNAEDSYVAYAGGFGSAPAPFYSFEDLSTRPSYAAGLSRLYTSSPRRLFIDFRNWTYTTQTTNCEVRVFPWDGYSQHIRLTQSATVASQGSAYMLFVLEPAHTGFVSVECDRIPQGLNLQP